MQKMINKPRILVVEDDASIRRGIVDALTMSSYDVLEASDGYQAEKIICTEDYDLALLDVVLPGPNGFQLLEKIKHLYSTIPVIMLTAKGAEGDKVHGLKTGADDYVVKPFSILELLARIESVLRRSPERPRPVDSLNLPHGHIDMSKATLTFPDGKQEELTQKEFELLRYLVEHPDRIISKEEILTRVWKMDPRMVETRSIDTTLARLREKLGETNASKIRTYRGKGYMWE